MKKLKIPRSLVLLIVFFIMFSILIVRLFQLQIVKGQEYENNFILQTKREIVLSGARGNIYDRNGKPLATNKLANSVTFEDQETYNSDRERQLNLNSKIYQMIRIIKSKGDSIETSLKIIIDRSECYSSIQLFSGSGKDYERAGRRRNLEYKLYGEYLWATIRMWISCIEICCKWIDKVSGKRTWL